jgi:hypothetical protein
MSKENRDIFTDIGIAAVVLVIALPLLYKGGCEPKSEPENDTIYIHDTIRIVEPTPADEDVVRHDTASFPMVGQSEPKGELKNIPICNELDSIGWLSNGLSNDSAKVVIPIIERTYEDSTYKAVVRGYNPELVSLDIYNSTRTITKTKQPKVVVGIGPYVGFGNKGFNYGVAVNVSMPIWSW